MDHTQTGHFTETRWDILRRYVPEFYTVWVILAAIASLFVGFYSFIWDFWAWLFGHVTDNPLWPVLFTVLVCLMMFHAIYALGMTISTPHRVLVAKDPLGVWLRLIDGVTAWVLYISVIAVPIGWLALQLADKRDPPMPIAAALVITVVIATILARQKPAGLHILSTLTGPLRRQLSRRFRGLGESAIFAGLWKEWEKPWYPGALFLGKSLSNNLYIGTKRNLHYCVIAGERSGKLTDTIINQITLLPPTHNLVVHDPAAESAFITAGIGNRKPAFVIDPMGYVKGTRLEPYRIISYNPLADIDPSYRENAINLIETITSAIVVSDSDRTERNFWEKKARNFWEESSDIIFNAMIGHILTAPDLAGRRSLATLWDFFTMTPEDFDRLVAQMASNRALGGLVQYGAAQISRGSWGSSDNIFVSLQEHVKFLSEPHIRAFLSGPNAFSILDIASKPMSIYLCSQGDVLTKHYRLSRLLLMLAYKGMENPRGRRKHKCFLLLDEFERLGELPLLASNAADAPKYGITMMIVLQYLKQVQTLYKDWEAFFANAAATQVFGISQKDQKTLEWISEMLSKTRSIVEGTMRRDRTGWFTKSSPLETDSVHTSALLTPAEIAEAIDAKLGRSFVFIKGAPPFIVERVDYRKLLHPSMYRRNPLYAGVPQPRNPMGWTREKYFGSHSIILKWLYKGTLKPREVRVTQPKSPQHAPVSCRKMRT